MKASKIASPIIRLAFGPKGIPLAQMTGLVMLVEQVIIKHDLVARSAECVLSNEGDTVSLADPDGVQIMSLDLASLRESGVIARRLLSEDGGSAR